MSEPLTLYYAHDPMCSFCWAFRPVWTDVQSRLKASLPEIQIRYLLGGLAPDSNDAMPGEVQTKVRAAWRYIETNIPGTRFNHDFWETQQPRRSTYPSCRAVYAVKMRVPSLEDAMIQAIQQAYYLNAKNPSNADTLIECATSIGLDAGTFVSSFENPQCESGFRGEMAFSRSIGISSFPSIVLTRGKSRFNVPIEYNDADLLLESLRQTAALL